MPRSLRSYQLENARLKQIIRECQWVTPVYNGSASCSGCGNMKHWMCDSTCPVAKVTGDFGKLDT